MKVRDNIGEFSLTSKGDFILDDTLKKALKRLKGVTEGYPEEIVVAYDNKTDKRLLLRVDRLGGEDKFVGYYYQMVRDNIGIITAEVISKKLIKAKTIKDALESFYDWSLGVS